MKRTISVSLKSILVLVAAILCVTAYLVWTSIRYPKNQYSEDQLDPFLTASEIELFSVYPSLISNGDSSSTTDLSEMKPRKTAIVNFHGYPVLGACKIAKPDEISDVRKAIGSLNVAGQHWGGAITECFDPRHGIRIRSGEVTLDLLICYECSLVQIFRGDNWEGNIYFALSEVAPRPTADTLNRILTAHAIALPEQPKH